MAGHRLGALPGGGYPPPPRQVMSLRGYLPPFQCTPAHSPLRAAPPPRRPSLPSLAHVPTPPLGPRLLSLVEHLDDLSNADDCHGCITHHLLTLPEANALRQQLDAVPDESPYMRTVVRDWQSPTFRLRPGGLQYWYFNHLVAGGSVTARWEFDGGAHVYFAKSGSAPVPVGHSASAHGTRGFQVWGGGVGDGVEVVR